MKMIRTFIAVTFCFITFSGYCHDHISPIDLQAIKNFKDAVSKGNKTEIVKYISFPLKRYYPLPSIETPKQLLEQFDEVFDTKLIELIVNSDIEKDWSRVGWRGILGPKLWMTETYYCEESSLFMAKLLEKEPSCTLGEITSQGGQIYSINYQSEAERIKWEELIKLRNRDLHVSLRDYLEPILNWDTNTYKARVDRVKGGDSDGAIIGFGMKVGEGEYRLSLWKQNKKQIELPDLVLYGKPYFCGSGNPNCYKFIDKEYIYDINHGIGGGGLYICKNNDSLCSQQDDPILIEEAYQFN